MSNSGQGMSLAMRLKASTDSTKEQSRTDRMDVDCVSYDLTANGQLARLPTELILQVAFFLDDPSLCHFAAITLRNWTSLRLDCHRRALKVALPTPEEYKQFEKVLAEDDHAMRSLTVDQAIEQDAIRCVIHERSKFVTAVSKGHLLAVKSFLEHGVDPNSYSIFGNRVLILAGSCYVAVEMTQLLLTYGADPNLPDVVSSRSTPLYAAAASAQDVLARVLMDHGADIKQKGAIHILCRICTRETVELAIKRGADLHQRDNSNNTVVHRAAQNEDPGVLALLFDLDIAPIYINAHNNSGKAPLLKALKTGRLQNMLTLLKHGADANCEYSHGMTALHTACWLELVDEALLLIEAGANVNAVDGDGNRPLHYAAAIPSRVLVQRLVEHGADTRAKDHNGATPLVIVCSDIVCSQPDNSWANEGDLCEIVNTLVEATAAVEAQNSEN